MVHSVDENPPPALPPSQSPPRSRLPRDRRRVSFGEDFRRFFLSGMAALLPTLITLWLLVWAWNFLWESLGRHIIFGIGVVWHALGNAGLVPFMSYGAIRGFWDEHPLIERVIGVLLAVLLVYIIGVIVGNFIGRTFYRLIESAVMRIPLVRAVYPAVKQITDFVLAKRSDQFAASRVVAVQPHEQGIWSIGLITGGALKPLNDQVGEELVTVFVPSTPTAFSGYVLVVPRRKVVELPMTVEEAMRLLVSGGVIVPEAHRAPSPSPSPPKQVEQPAREFENQPTAVSPPTPAAQLSELRNGGPSSAANPQAAR